LVTTLEEKGIYGLVGSPERLKILEELKTGPKDRGYFINLLHLWPQAVKYHVDILVDGELVDETWSRKGRRKKIYTLTEKGERAISTGPGKNYPSEAWIAAFLGPEGKEALSYLSSISDGEWHNLKEARDRVGEAKLEILERNGMLETDEEKNMIRMRDFNLTISSDWIRSLAGSESGDNPWST
jgi:DNA-binding MarR family transcriptional regulator